MSMSLVTGVGLSSRAAVTVYEASALCAIPRPGSTYLQQGNGYETGALFSRRTAVDQQGLNRLLQKGKLVIA
jgi:hypothetical protein